MVSGKRLFLLIVPDVRGSERAAIPLLEILDSMRPAVNFKWLSETQARKPLRVAAASTCRKFVQDPSVDQFSIGSSFGDHGEYTSDLLC